jgi:hypothetical protein
MTNHWKQQLRNRDECCEIARSIFVLAKTLKANNDFITQKELELRRSPQYLSLNNLCKGEVIGHLRAYRKIYEQENIGFAYKYNGKIYLIESKAYKRIKPANITLKSTWSGRVYKCDPSIIYFSSNK